MSIPAGMEERYYQPPDPEPELEDDCGHEPPCTDPRDHDELLREDAAIDAEDARREEGYY